MSTAASTDQTPVVECRNLTVRFGSFTALGEVSFTIPAKGEFVTIIGPSGCGKSTLLNVIAGFLQPSEGEILIPARPLRGLALDEDLPFARLKKSGNHVEEGAFAAPGGADDGNELALRGNGKRYLTESRERTESHR